MVCLFGHKWNGCKCERCGKVRDGTHDWNGCKCSRCGAQRDEQHVWDGCKCSRCGARRNTLHRWERYQCSRCGKRRDAREIHDLHELEDIVRFYCLEPNRSSIICYIKEPLKKLLASHPNGSIGSKFSIGFNASDRSYRSLEYDNESELTFALICRELNTDPYSSLSAVKKMTSQYHIAYVAKYAYFVLVREAAIAMLEDRTVLKEIEKNEGLSGIRKAAADRLAFLGE